MPTPSNRASSTTAFLAMEIFQRAHELSDAGCDVIHLEVGEPDFHSPPAAVSAARHALEAGRTRYTHSMGIPPLRAAIAAKLTQECGARIDPGRVMVTMGSSAALLLAFTALLDPGDEVLVPDPGYPCYPNIARALGAVPVPVPVRAEDEFVLDPALTGEHITARTKAIVVNSPANPTGTITPPGVLAELASLNIALVSDEVYSGLSYKHECVSAAALSEDVFVVGGLSKRYAMTGWRLGWLVMPPAFVKPVMALQQNLFVSPADFVQHAAIGALTARDEVERMRRAYEHRRDVMLEAVAGAGFGVPAPPQGAFYVFADARSFTGDSLAFCRDILERTHVAVTPGIDFGARGEGYVRFSYAASAERIVEGLGRIKGYLGGR